MHNVVRRFLFYARLFLSLREYKFAYLNTSFDNAPSQNLLTVTFIIFYLFNI